MDRIQRSEGRRLFGSDPDGYDLSRPDYPDWVFEALRASGALFNGAVTLEIGPGSGLATAHLIERGADPITLIEPDGRLGDRLHSVLNKGRDGGRSGTSGTIVESSFEDARLPDEHFDLVAAATAYHWIDPRKGLAKVSKVLKTRGTAALFWNVFQDLEKTDDFHEATRSLLIPLASSPSGAPDTLPFALDRTAREREARQAGFEDIVYEESRWSYEISSEQIGHLYGNFSSIQRLEPAERTRLLEALIEIAERQFDGRVTRNMTTCLYQLRRTSS